MRTHAVRVAAAVALLGAGCAHERVGRPPSTGEIGYINQEAEQRGWFRIVYDEPPDRACAAGSCGEAIAAWRGFEVVEPIGLVAADPAWITFRTAAGEERAVPADLVAGVSVRDRPRGAAIGAGVGLAWGALTVAALYLLAAILPADPGAPREPCDDTCVARGLAGYFIVPTAVGAAIGYLVGARRTFDFGDR